MAIRTKTEQFRAKLMEAEICRQNTAPALGATTPASHSQYSSSSALLHCGAKAAVLDIEIFTKLVPF